VAASKNNFLDHVRFLRQAVLAHGGELIIAGNSMQALLRQGMRHWVLLPQFLATIDGVRQYTSSFVDEASHFAGWLPYSNKRWPLASDKLAFKRFVTSVGLKTPRFSESPGTELNNVVVKRVVSSFGEQVLGPFRTSNERLIDAAQGEYYERFIEGNLLKIWYWNGQAVCVEQDFMPFVKGDGISTLGELIMARANLSKWHNDNDKAQVFARSADLLRYFGRTIDTVLDQQARQRIEFRYGSDLMHQSDRKVIDLQQVPTPAWAASLSDIGQKLYAAIPEPQRKDAVFTVDAILDSKQVIWLLEMNSNPTIHPLVYPEMIASLMSMSLADQKPRSSLDSVSAQSSIS